MQGGQVRAELGGHLGRWGRGNKGSGVQVPAYTFTQVPWSLPKAGEEGNIYSMTSRVADNLTYRYSINTVTTAFIILVNIKFALRTNTTLILPW